MPNNSCSVPTCPFHKKFNSSLELFKFPSDPVLRHKWREAIVCSDANFKIRKLSFVCSSHFISGTWVDNPFSTDYVPSIFPKGSSIAKSELPITTYSQSKKTNRSKKMSDDESVPDAGMQIDSDDEEWAPAKKRGGGNRGRGSKGGSRGRGRKRTPSPEDVVVEEYEEVGADESEEEAEPEEESEEEESEEDEPPPPPKKRRGRQPKNPNSTPTPRAKKAPQKPRGPRTPKTPTVAEATKGPEAADGTPTASPPKKSTQKKGPVEIPREEQLEKKIKEMEEEHGRKIESLQKKYNMIIANMREEHQIKVHEMKRDFESEKTKIESEKTKLEAEKAKLTAEINSRTKNIIETNGPKVPRVNGETVEIVSPIIIQVTGADVPVEPLLPTQNSSQTTALLASTTPVTK